MTKGDKVTAEFYGDPLLVNLIGAVDVPEKRMMEATQSIGKAICRAIGISLLETVLLDTNGDEIDRIVVHR